MTSTSTNNANTNTYRALDAFHNGSCVEAWQVWPAFAGAEASSLDEAVQVAKRDWYETTWVRVEEIDAEGEIVDYRNILVAESHKDEEGYITYTGC